MELNGAFPIIYNRQVLPEGSTRPPARKWRTHTL